MIDDEAPVAGVGHNSGSMLEAARADLADALHDARIKGKTFAERKAEFIASAAAQKVNNRETAAAAADTIKLAGEVWAMIDATRRERSDPYRETHLALSAAATDFWEPVVGAMKGLRDQIDTWTEQEDARIAAQAREQEEEMRRLRGEMPPNGGVPKKPLIFDEEDAYSRPAPDPVIPPRPRAAPPEMREPRRAKIRGDLGAVLSVRDVDSYEIEDFSLLPDHILKSKTVTDAILAVVKATARHMGVPPGIRVVTTTGNQIR